MSHLFNSHVMHIQTFVGNAVFKRPLSPTISFLPTRIEGRLFVLGDFCGASSCSRTGCRPIYAWHDSFICVTWLIHTCDTTHSHVNEFTGCPIYAGHDSFIRRRTWLVHMCRPDILPDIRTIYTHERVMSCVFSFICVGTQVARYTHDPNGIIDARSASPLAPDLVAAISDEGLWNLASLLSLCDQKYTMRSDILILDPIVSRFGTWKGVFKRLLFLWTCEWVVSHMWMSHFTHVNESCHTYERVMSCVFRHVNESCYTCKWVVSQMWMSHVTHMNVSCHAYSDMSEPCRVLQCVAVCCSVMQCVAVCCSVMSRVFRHVRAMQSVAVCCSVMQCVAVWCSVLQCHVTRIQTCPSHAECCSALQCVAVRCSVLQWHVTRIQTCPSPSHAWTSHVSLQSIRLLAMISNKGCDKALEVPPPPRARPATLHQFTNTI